MTADILLLGSTGFIGQNVANILDQRDVSYLGISKSSGVDLVDEDHLCAVITQVQPKAIINCAAIVGGVRWVSENPATVMDKNTRLVLSLYGAVRRSGGQCSIVNPVANCVYPGEQTRLREEAIHSGPPDRSVLGFASSRRLLLELSAAHATECGIRSTNLVIPNSYGPPDSVDPHKTHALNGMVIRMLKAKFKGEPSFEVWGSGRPVREWIFGEDVGRILADAALLPVAFTSPVNVGCGESCSIADLANMIRSVVGYSGEIVFQASGIEGVKKKEMVVEKFRSLYPEFNLTPLSVGIRRTVDYYGNLLNPLASAEEA